MCGAAEVLAAGVDQQQAVAFDGGKRARRGAVMRHRAIGIEAGDDRERQADEVLALRAFAAQLLVDRQFADLVAARQRAFEPGVEAAHRGAVFGHRVANEFGLGGGLAALGQRARVDGFDHRDGGRHALAKVERDAARIDQQRAAARQCGQRRGGLRIVGHGETIRGELDGECRIDLAGRHEECRARCIDQQVGEEDRVVVDVGTAQVGHPGHVIDGRHEVMRGAMAHHRFAHRREFGRASGARLRRTVRINRRARQARPLGPDAGQKVGIGAQGHARFLEPGAQGLRRRQADHLPIDGHRAAARYMRCEPLDVVRGGAGRNLHQFDAAAAQLAFGLRPIAAVGEQRCAFGGDDQRGHRTGEARQPDAALPALGQIFRQMRVARRHQQCRQLVRRQRIAHALEAQGIR